MFRGWRGYEMISIISLKKLNLLHSIEAFVYDLRWVDLPACHGELMRKQTLLLKVIALSCTMLACQAAHAQFDLHRLSVRVGPTTIVPNVKSGDLSAPSVPGTKIDVDSATGLTGGLNYALTDNLSIDFPLDVPFRFDVNGAGALNGVGKLADIKALPISLLAQYRFGPPSSVARPYVGAGVAYTRFFGARSGPLLSPASLSMKNAWAGTAQLGLEVPFNDKWSLDVAATYVHLKTTGMLSTGQTIDVALNPTSYSLALAYRF
jgi:outer membrane protein